MPIKKAVAEVAEVVGVNATILSVTTFTNLETLLKILLLIVSIGYTINKWYHIRRGKE
tara:strand:+ start:165 stop:338 length:174 start_codon:yes stop_codon:yes gene_type:complete